MIQKDYRLAAILYTDIVGFSKMMEKDEAGTLRILDLHNSILEDAIQQNQGTVIKTIGDAYLADFRNTQQALQAAITVQQKLYEYNCAHTYQPLLVRIGIHLGDIYFYENDALGDGINIAARLQGYCRPGCICFSQDVFNQVQNKIEFHAEKLGKIELKNISKEIIGYEIVTDNSQFNPDHDTARRKASDQETRQRQSDTNNARTESNHGTSSQPLTGSDVDQAIKNLVTFVEQKVSGFIDSADRMNHISRDTCGDHDRQRNRNRDRYNRHIFHTDDVLFIDGKDLITQIRDEVMDGFSGENRHTSKLSEKEVFDRYVRKIKHAGESAISRFIGHAIPFLVVTMSLRHFFPHPGFPWPIVVTLAWGIGITSHFFSALNAKRLWSAVKKLPQLGQNALRLFKKWQNGKASLMQQVASCLSVPALLFFINRHTSPAVPWAMIPCGIIFLTTVIELIAFPVRNAGKKKAFLAAAEGSLPQQEINNDVTEELDIQKYPLYTEAVRIQDDILQQLTKINAEQPEYNEMISSALSDTGKTAQDFLQEYTQQIKKTETDIERINSVLKTVPLHSILQERKDIESQLQAETSAEIRNEYERALLEIDRQRQSYKDLANHKQVLTVRLKTAVNSMNKLKLDIMKIAAGVASTEKADVIHLLESRTNDLRLYIDDLQTGYKETEQAIQ